MLRKIPIETQIKHYKRAYSDYVNTAVLKECLEDEEWQGFDGLDGDERRRMVTRNRMKDGMGHGLIGFTWRKSDYLVFASGPKLEVLTLGLADGNDVEKDVTVIEQKALPRTIMQIVAPNNVAEGIGMCFYRF